MESETLKPERDEKDIKKVKYDCKQYEMNIDKEAYRLQIEIFEDQTILLKLRKIKCLSYVFFLKEFKYKEILETLDLREKDYNNLEQVLKLLDTLINNNNVKLYRKDDNINIILTKEKMQKLIHLEEEIKYKTSLYKTVEEITKMKKNGAASIDIINRLNEINDNHKLDKLQKDLEKKTGEEKEKIQNQIYNLKQIKQKKNHYKKLQSNKNIKNKKKNEINLIFYGENVLNYYHFYGIEEIFINGVKQRFILSNYMYDNVINLPYEGFYYITLVFKSNITNCSHMFKDGNFIYIDLSSFDTQNVTNMQEMFYGCKNLINIDLSSLNTQNVTNMQDMFHNCFNLINIDFSSLNTQNVTNMEGMFCNCNNLVNIDLSSFNTQNVKNMQNMFHNCYNLVNIDLSSFYTKKVTNMEGMFSNCENLVYVDLSNFSIFNNTNVEDLFEFCTNLNKIKINKLLLPQFENIINKEIIELAFNE